MELDEFYRTDVPEARTLLRALARFDSISPKTAGLQVAFELAFGSPAEREQARLRLSGLGADALLPAKHALNLNPDLGDYTILVGRTISGNPKYGYFPRAMGNGGQGMVEVFRGHLREAEKFFQGKKGSEGYKKAQKDFTTSLMNHPQTALYRDYGTQSIPSISDGFGALPTRNFSAGHFEQVETISGDYMRDLLLRRGGESNPTHACMAGCTIRCSNIFGGEDGKMIVSPLEYETVGLMGSNLGIGVLDDVARMNWQVNDLGLDSIEIGAALGVACEGGLMQFGDAARALELIDEIRRGTILGRVLGMGAGMTGKVLGVERVPVVKNQAMSAYEPRALKGTGVTFATTPQGADHTCGLTLRAKVNHTDPKGQAALSLGIQLNMAGYDTLGACVFAGFGYTAAPNYIPDLLKARYGWDVPANILQELGRQTIKMEREWNRRAGFTRKDDRLPEWMKREALPPLNTVFDVPDEDLDTIYDNL